MASFITIEGIDGTGKSSVCRSLGERLTDAGYEVMLTREPSDSWLGKIVNDSLVRDISPFSEALLFCADRAEHTREIVKTLESGAHVLCDRYMDSTIAYQGVMLKDSYEGDDLLRWLETVNRPLIVTPTATIFLKAPPEICLGRIGNRDNMSKFEQLEILSAVESNYLEISKWSDRFITVDATETLERVVETALGHIIPILE